MNQHSSKPLTLAANKTMLSNLNDLTKKLTYILIAVLAIGCSQNLWTANGLLRPKKPKFSILKEQFVTNALIHTKHLYISTKRFTNYDGNKLVTTYGFYSDGRFIVNSFNEPTIDIFICNRTSWDSSQRIGYYTTQNNQVKCQYFEQYGGGEYIELRGQIKQDTIIFADKYSMPLKKEIRYDTIIKSSYIFH